MMKFLAFRALFITRAQFLGIVSGSASDERLTCSARIRNLANKSSSLFSMGGAPVLTYLRTYFDEFMDVSKADHRLGTSASETRKLEWPNVLNLSEIYTRPDYIWSIEDAKWKFSQNATVCQCSHGCGSITFGTCNTLFPYDYRV